ncbi:nucleoside phosphorylase [Croceitalea sp. MTPC9]|uniref:nucleoside phosphorylase n=1 Tax=unclassified Croceitalea TaxID=2632280 RepID=UPI002B38A610|nr:nucleoside phosphorylase [Croceitalea sp. MTPC6]GMN15676.1 nucleoside phosphorylase [Croceitalea sp. MTPC9]
MPLAASELILNADGSIYHLNLLPQDIAKTIITVGDPERVSDVSKHFDKVEVKKEKREFHTHTGIVNGKRISVISTGIGTDNIDIVFNELDALVNIDFTTRTEKTKKTRLDFIRIGTSGAIQLNIPIDSFLLTETAIGLDGLMHFYKKKIFENQNFSDKLIAFLKWESHNITPYVFDCSPDLANSLKSNRIRFGTTVTNAGFYGPQGRSIRLNPKLEDFHQKLSSFKSQGKQITNLEMETAGIYGLAKLLGHRAVSMNAILANRATGEFSNNPSKTVEELIKYCLEKIS